MKTAFTGFIVVVFASVLFTGLLSLFDGNAIGQQMDRQLAHYPYYMSY